MKPPLKLHQGAVLSVATSGTPLPDTRTTAPITAAATTHNVSAANGTLPPIVRASAAFDAACTGINAPLMTAMAQSNTVVLIEPPPSKCQSEPADHSRRDW